METWTFWGEPRYGFITFECQEDASRVQEQVERARVSLLLDPSFSREKKGGASNSPIIQGTVYLKGKKLNIGPAIRKQVRNLDDSTRCIGEFRLT